ncbi:hypothetical protein JTB14_002624 [Gonioctena quinquepunctata]|nr:hypothetical protein JTB14_002624 [Gonioctena quinquepunctata]
MIASIRTLSKDNEHLGEELKKLKYDNFTLRNSQKSMNSKNDLRKDLKTNIIVPNKAMPTARTTSSECEVHSIPQLHLDPIYDNSNKKLVPKKGRIMIVSGHYARNLASFFKYPNSRKL